eukprot:3219447-Alexandrium_andersonii.AAC.1
MGSRAGSQAAAPGRTSFAAILVIVPFVVTSQAEPEPFKRVHALCHPKFFASACSFARVHRVGLLF